MTGDDFDKEQYRALREEILRAMEDGNHVMSFGLAGAGVALSVGVAHSGTVLGFIILSVFVPAIAALVLSMWFGTAERVARASHFLYGVEMRLKANDRPSWEQWLRNADSSGTSKTAGQHFWSTEYAGVAIFGLLVVAPVIASWWAGGTHVGHGVHVFAAVIVAVTAMFSLFRFRVRLSRWRTWLTTGFAE